MDEREFLRERLSQLRCLKDISARDMSISLGKAHGYINSIENGKAMPSMENFFSICDFLEITAGEFFNDDTSLPETTRLLIEAVRRLSEEESRQALVILDAVFRNLP